MHKGVPAPLPLNNGGKPRDFVLAEVSARDWVPDPRGAEKNCEIAFRLRFPPRRHAVRF
jgi:hypothetical protein